VKNYFDVPKISGDKEPPCKHYRGSVNPLESLCAGASGMKGSTKGNPCIIAVNLVCRWQCRADCVFSSVATYFVPTACLLWTELVSSLTVSFVSVDFWCFRFATANRLHVSCSGKTEGPLWWINVHTIVCCVTVTSNQCSVTAIAYWKQRTV